jgi:hypothetical protein
MNDVSPVGSADGGSTAAGRSAISPPVLEDDMIDTPADFSRWPFLRHVLGEYHDVLIRTYLEADHASLDAQSSHRRWVICAAFSATLAVALAIVQLAIAQFPGLPKGYVPYMVAFEVLAVLAALLAFSVGNKTRREWLTARHKAERCRFLKFSSLILPDVYKQGELLREGCANQLGDQVEIVKTLGYKDVEGWLADDSLPSPPGRISARSFTELTELRDYYREKRLDFQAAYFKKQAERDVQTDERWRRALPWFFGASVGFVAIHLIFHALEKHEYRALPVLEMLALACAALLPVFSSGVRTWRSAREATRNMNRFRAKHFALTNISQRLAATSIRTDADAEGVLRDLWCSEQIMEAEHREWLRLMVEAEWMG